MLSASPSFGINRNSPALVVSNSRTFHEVTLVHLCSIWRKRWLWLCIFGDLAMWPDFFSQDALEVRLPQTVASLQTLKNSKESYVCILRTFKIPFHSIVTLVPCSRLRFSLNGLLRLISRKFKILCHWIVTLASLAPLGFFFFRFIRK